MAIAKSAARGRSSPIVWVVLAAAAFAAMLLAWRGRGAAAPHPAVGQRLAFAQLEPLTGDGPPVTAKEFQGKVTLINFWGPWCEHCLREMPHLVRLRAEFAARGDVQFLLVSCSPDWQPNTPPALGWSENLPQLTSHTADLLAARQWNVPTWCDPHGKTRRAFTGLDAWDGYPTTLVVDRGGVIQYVGIGFSLGDEHVLEEALHKLVEAPPGERGT